MKMMQDREVWVLVPKPEKEKVLGSRWVYTLKKNEENQVVRYKARLVAQGFGQRKGESYDEVFNPVVNFSLIRFFFAILVCKLKWHHIQLDVKCAYLYADLPQKTYMYQPKGFVDPQKPDNVCLLKKALYGLHQSGREWFFEIHKVLENLNFHKIESCNCVYRFEDNVVLLLYVDDIVVLGKTPKHISRVVRMLQQKFDLKYLGKTRKLLGVQFEEKDGKLSIHQEEYISKIGELFEKFKFPTASLPIAKGIVLSKIDCPGTFAERKEMEDLPFRNLLGCLSYIAGRTRPDICYAVNIFSQFAANPGKRHWYYLLKLLGYVVQTRSQKLCLSNISDIGITCYSDADFAANRDDRISIGGIILLIDQVPVFWRTFKQKCVSLSTMEAEYVTLAEAAKEVLWFSRILNDCSACQLFKVNFDHILLCDNRAAIDFSKSPIENSRTKHIDVKYHFIRNLVNDNLFKIKYVNSKSNVADMFTKPVTKESLAQVMAKYTI